MATKKKRGRPKGAVAEETRDALIQIKVYVRDKDAYEAAAKRDGLTMSAWIRQQLNKATRSE
jgi:hypothetical protein